MILNKPPMGRNTWNTFGENINEKLIIETVDALVESGLKDVGYEYIVIDDTRALKERNAEGRIAVGLFNFRDEKLEMFDSIITLDMLGLPIISGKKLVLKDLWTKEITESSNGTIPLTECAPHSCRIFRAKIVDA